MEQIRYTKNLSMALAGKAAEISQPDFNAS